MPAPLCMPHRSVTNSHGLPPFVSALAAVLLATSCTSAPPPRPLGAATSSLQPRAEPPVERTTPPPDPVDSTRPDEEPAPAAPEAPTEFRALASTELGAERQEIAGPAEPPRPCRTGLEVTELLIDPAATPDELGEYVELFNRGPEPIDLRGWRLSNGRGKPHIFNGPTALTIPPGATVLVGQSMDLDENGDLQLLATVGRFSLPNEGGLVHLKNPCGESVARFRYGVRAPWPKRRRGVAIERISTSHSMDDPRGWRSARKRAPSGDRGSPGDSTPFRIDRTPMTQIP